jgi:hypothetical protein
MVGFVAAFEPVFAAFEWFITANLRCCLHAVYIWQSALTGSQVFQMFAKNTIPGSVAHSWTFSEPLAFRLALPLIVAPSQQPCCGAHPANALIDLRDAQRLP